MQVLSLKYSFLFFFSSAGEEGHAPRSPSGSLLRHWEFALRISLEQSRYIGKQLKICPL